LSNPHHPKPWHRGSIFGDGTRTPLDRNGRARFRFLLNAYRRARRLTRAAVDVGEALVKRLGDDGRCDPSHETLARDAGCSESTIGRSLVQMRDLGLLRWDRRIVRNGWRAEQTSNQYQLDPTGESPAPLPNRPVPCDRHFERETRTDVIQIPGLEVKKAQEALARVRQRMEARMLGMVAGYC
jgi:hypothetical protein